MSETLDQALRRVWKDDWQFRASGKSLLSQAEKARATLASCIFLSDVTEQHLKDATGLWYKEGLSPATITKRLNCLSKLGVSVEGTRPVKRKQTKWFLPMDKVYEVCFWIEEEADRRVVPYDLARFIRWTVHTGLRVEETLRLRSGDFPNNFKEVSVPGRKTDTSQATLPLGEYPRMLAYSQCLDYVDHPFIESSYTDLQRGWQAVREKFGWQDIPTATLKALRRSAARYLHCDCGMPLHLVQQYLRHESMDTTLEYLRLTGGYNTEEMRRFLK